MTLSRFSCDQAPNINRLHGKVDDKTKGGLATETFPTQKDDDTNYE